MKKKVIKNTGEHVYVEKLKNGLEIVMIPNSKVKNFYITLSAKFGSIHTNFKYKGTNYSLPKGIAHYLEHLLFNMPDGSIAFDYYAKYGANINAFTTYDYTCYEVFANSNFKENLSYLLEFVYTPYFTKELVSGEKGIITEEIKMIGDNPSSEIVYGMYRNIFMKDERQYLISGTIEDVKKITANDLNLAYEAFYHPENMFLVITGNFKPTEAIAIATEAMKDMEFEQYSKPIIKEVKEPLKVRNAYSEKEMPVDRSKVTLGIKIPKNNFKSMKLSDLELRMYLNLITRINFGETSLLKEEMLSNGIITDSISTYLTTTNDYYVIAFLASTDYPEYFIKRIEEKLAKLTISKEELDRKVKSSISNLIMSFDEIEIVNSDIQDDMVSDGEYLLNIYDYYRSLNVDIANEIINKLEKNTKSITVLKPKSEK